MSHESPKLPGQVSRNSVTPVSCKTSRGISCVKRKLFVLLHVIMVGLLPCVLYIHIYCIYTRLTHTWICSAVLCAKSQSLLPQCSVCTDLDEDSSIVRSFLFLSPSPSFSFSLLREVCYVYREFLCSPGRGIDCERHMHDD